MPEKGDFPNDAPLRRGDCRAAALNQLAECGICGANGHESRIVSLTGLSGVVKICATCAETAVNMGRIPT